MKKLKQKYLELSVTEEEKKQKSDKYINLYLCFMFYVIIII